MKQLFFKVKLSIAVKTNLTVLKNFKDRFRNLVF